MKPDTLKEAFLMRAKMLLREYNAEINYSFFDNTAYICIHKYIDGKKIEADINIEELGGE